MRPLLDRADRHLDDVRLVGDAAVAAFFSADRPRERTAQRGKILEVLELGGSGWQQELLPAVKGLRNAEKPVHPFHFEIEFPEMFDRNNPGFDAIVGNPPFGGKNTVINANALNYPLWLKLLHAESHGNADLVAHFFRRAFGLCCVSRAHSASSPPTPSVRGIPAQPACAGSARTAARSYSAQRRIQWPGEAAVVVSVLHILKGTPETPKRLDGVEVPTISAFLFHRGGHDDPERLEANAGKSFQGSILLGMGFTFDDTDGKGAATPLAEMRNLIDEDPRYEEAIFSYIGGEEVNTSPTHAYHRYAINFFDYPLRREEMLRTWRQADEDQRRIWLQTGVVPQDYPKPVAADWPSLLSIVEEKTKPERDVQKRKALRERWWHYAEKRPGLYATIADLDRVLAINCGATPHLSFSFLSSNMVFANTLVVLPFDSCSAFCVLQSRPHEIWARFFASSMKDDLRYTPSDCFETFPFPNSWEPHPALEAAGEAYYDFRSALMVENDEGMTKTYNRFHDPDGRDPRIAELRELHAAMDRAVLRAYGWDDISTDCEFLLDYEIDEETWGKKKKPWRYRWPDEVRDEVLARLLALNAERAAAESLARLSARAEARPSKVSA